jgi:hypothetical protein
MINVCLFLSPVVLLVIVFLFSSSTVAHATVFAWKGEGGALHFSNDPEEVPEAHRTSARQFTAKLAGKAAPENPALASPPSSPPAESTSAYERGLERGLIAAERQMEMTNEILKTTLQAVRQPPPPQTIIIQQQPADPVVRYVDRNPYPVPYYGFVSPYSSYWGVPYAYHYPYGFSRGRLVPHSHFFPGTRRRSRGLFFPHGHSTHHGFLSGHGIVIR